MHSLQPGWAALLVLCLVSACSAGAEEPRLADSGTPEASDSPRIAAQDAETDTAPAPEDTAPEEDPGTTNQDPGVHDPGVAVDDGPPPPDASGCTSTVRNVIVSIGEAESAGGLKGLSKPSLALDSGLSAHVVADRGLPEVVILHRSADGAWSEETFAVASDYGTARIHLPHIEIDGADRAWVSGWFGAKGMPGGKMGQGVWRIDNVATAPTSTFLTIANVGKKNGNLALDPGQTGRCTVMTREGQWEQIDADGGKVASGKMWVGTSGEKIRFAIRPVEGGVGVWHAVMSGWSKHSSAYQNSTAHKAGAEPAIWALNKTYPEMGEDVRHPGLGLDRVNPNAAYIAIQYKPGVVINIWDGTSLLYAPESLPVVTPDSATHGNGGERFGPQWASVPGGGAFLCWTSADKQITLRYVSPTGALGAIQDVGPGRQCEIMSDPAGDLHLAYVDGTLRYRKITTATECD